MTRAAEHADGYDDEKHAKDENKNRSAKQSLNKDYFNLKYYKIPVINTAGEI